VLSGELNMTYDPVLIHADMAVYHILHDPTSRQLSGILDFGTAGLGDPATDIAVFLVNFGESLTEQMGYPKLEALLPRARFWAGTMELEWALAGVKKTTKGWRWHISLGPEMLESEQKSERRGCSKQLLG
jgi:aminoglycoside 2''-phosphotransferase